MIPYALTIFLGAFLLFLVQPLLGKCVLPWFGGSPAVWTTCMLFFQVLLLAGYGYAHLLSTQLRGRAATLVHAALLAASLACLPILPDAQRWKPATAAAPTGQILLLLAATVGLPYFLLSATGPLLQDAVRRRFGRAPYRLYALSNVGSLLALVAFPFVFEPQLALRQQAWLWSAAYALFAAGCAWCLAAARQRATGHASPPTDAQPAEPPTARQVLVWLGLAASGSLLLLATTNQVCQDVAVVPFLWVVPLAAYLLTFIISFDKHAWYSRRRFLGYLATGCVLSCLSLSYSLRLPLWLQLTIYLGTLLAGCMVCHGELARSKPDPRYLTWFYLVIAAGGALGGLFGAIVAPYCFLGLWEFPVALVAACLLAVAACRLDGSAAWLRGAPRWATAAASLFIAGLLLALAGQAWGKVRGAVEVDRNFYGVLSVARDPARRVVAMTHGQIEHGYQFTLREQRGWPTAYYGPNSGVGLALAHHPRRRSARPDERSLGVGVVGLGCGTLAAYGRPGDRLRFYEINPAVERMAREHFSFLRDSPARVEVELGDARLLLEREAGSGAERPLDVLVVDAFSGDSIPMHLLTRECVRVYRRRLAADGLLCLHISNKHLDLTRLARGHAAELGYQALWFNSPAIAERGVGDASWVVLTANRAFASAEAVRAALTPWPAASPVPIVWTDDYGSLWQVLR